MSPEQEKEIIVREFKKRNKRTQEEVLLTLQKKLTRGTGGYWIPPMSHIIYKARKLGIKVKDVKRR
jgi:hypothetical protein